MLSMIEKISLMPWAHFSNMLLTVIQVVTHSVSDGCPTYVSHEQRCLKCVSREIENIHVVRYVVILTRIMCEDFQHF